VQVAPNVRSSVGVGESGVGVVVVGVLVVGRVKDERGGQYALKYDRPAAEHRALFAIHAFLFRSVPCVGVSEIMLEIAAIVTYVTHRLCALCPISFVDIPNCEHCNKYSRHNNVTGSAEHCFSCEGSPANSGSTALCTPLHTDVESDA
jgi:hypothetical protein